MSAKLREALQHARNCLWWLLVQNGKGNLPLTDDQKAVIDQAEQLAEDALKNADSDEGGDQ